MRQYVAEFLGTFFLMFAIIFSGEPWAIGLLFASMVYIGGHISGGYFNPAVASAAWMCGSISLEQLGWYSAAEIAGAFLASVYSLWLSGDYFFLELPAGVLFTAIAMRELLLTFVLSMVVLTLTRLIRYRGNGQGALIVGVTLAAIVTMGGLYNPAVFLGVMLCTMLGSSMPSMQNILTFVGMPLLGGLLAAYVFKYLNPNEA